jgi:hypothetical protein
MQRVIKTAQKKDKVTDKAIRDVMSLNPKTQRAGSQNLTPVGGTGRKSTDDDDLSIRHRMTDGASARASAGAASRAAAGAAA